MASSKAVKELTQPTRSTLNKLFAVTGNSCPFPGCPNPLFDHESDTLLGQVCHIKGDRPGSARYDPGQTATERHGIQNLIVMCANHHKVIDTDIASWPVERLERLKAEHERPYKSGQPLEQSSKVTSKYLSEYSLPHVAERLVAAYAADRNPLWEQSLVMLNGINEAKGPLIAEQSDIVAVEDIDSLLDQGIQVVGRMLQRRGYF